MHLEWILSPVTQCAIFAIGLGLAVYLFLTLKIEIRAAARRGRRDQPEGEIRQLRVQVEELAAMLDGVPVGDHSRRSAQEMVGRARAFKLQARHEAQETLVV